MTDKKAKVEMTMRMTKEEVATLGLPEGWRAFLEFDIWYFRLNKSAAHVTSAESRLVDLAESVANGHLPRVVYDWALRSWKGGDIPTVEQWEATCTTLDQLGGQLKAESDWRQQFGGTPPTPEQWRAAAGLVDEVRGGDWATPRTVELCGVISPLKPSPLPTIAACPRCGGSCSIDATLQGALSVVSCNNSECNWEGPVRTAARDAINAHNEEALQLRPKHEANRLAPQYIGVDVGVLNGDKSVVTVPQSAPRATAPGPGDTEDHNEDARKLRPEEKVEQEPIMMCETCRHEYEQASLDPCRSCIRAGAGVYPGWEPKP